MCHLQLLFKTFHIKLWLPRALMLLLKFARLSEHHLGVSTQPSVFPAMLTQPATDWHDSEKMIVFILSMCRLCGFFLFYFVFCHYSLHTIVQQSLYDICAVLGVVSNLEMTKNAQEAVRIICSHNTVLQRGLEHLQIWKPIGLLESVLWGYHR